MNLRLFFALFLISLAACTPGLTPTVHQTESTVDILTLTPTYTNPSKISTATPTQAAEKTGWKIPCRELATKSPNKVDASGVVILDSRVSLDEGHYKPDTILLDMGTRKITHIIIQGENQFNHVISPNGRLIAYESILPTSDGNATKRLIIADADNNLIKVIPWGEEWFEMLDWLDSEHLLISLFINPDEGASEKPNPMLVLQPFSGEQRVLKLDIPGFRDTHVTNLPYWEGRWGVIYDPTLTYAIYPRIIKSNSSMHTYAIWDRSRQKLVASLEDRFTAFSAFNFYPMPKWSPDGSQFVFLGAVQTEDPVAFELYEVNRDGKTRQLTHLSSIAYIWESSYNWSPDGRHISMFLGPPRGAAFEKARVAVLDTVTLDVTDYCMPIAFSGEGYGGAGPSAPIWSPDGKQLLVVDWYEKDHRHVLLVDIEKNIATQIAEDMEPVGWMVKP